MEGSCILGAEIIYQSPKLRRLRPIASKSKKLECPSCLLQHTEMRSDPEVRCGCSLEASTKNKSNNSLRREITDCNCGISNNYNKSYITCSECVNINAKNDFWKNYDNVDREPVKGINSEDRLENMNEYAKEILILKSNNTKVKCEDEISRKTMTPILESNSEVTPKEIKPNDKTSIELQTDESGFDTCSSEDFFNVFVKNVLDKFFSGRNNVQNFYRIKYEQFLHNNRDKCRSAVEKVIQHMISEFTIADSTDSNESMRKEEELTSFNYKCECTTDTDNVAVSASSIKKHKKICDEGKFVNEKNVLITTETTINKNTVNLSNGYNDEIISSTDIVHQLLMKCLAVDKTGHRCDLGDSSPQPSTFKADTVNGFDERNFSKFNETSQNNVSADNIPKSVERRGVEFKDINPIEKESRNNLLERNIISQISIDKTVVNISSSINKIAMAKHNDAESSDRIETKYSKSSTNEKRSILKIPVKSSNGKIDLRLEDSDMKTKSSDFERRGFLAKLCFFLCRKC